MNIFLVIYILATHWVADFVFQNSYMALNKSKNNGALTEHIIAYTVVTVISYTTLLFVYSLFRDSMVLQMDGIVLFFILTFASHWITDYFTSRWTSRLHKIGLIYATPPNLGFFAVVGLDQLLHFAQLLICYKYLILNNI